MNGSLSRTLCVGLALCLIVDSLPTSGFASAFAIQHAPGVSQAAAPEFENQALTGAILFGALHVLSFGALGRGRILIHDAIAGKTFQAASIALILLSMILSNFRWSDWMPREALGEYSFIRRMGFINIKAINPFSEEGKTVSAFLEYLANHPEMAPPEYLSIEDLIFIRGPAYQDIFFNAHDGHKAIFVPLHLLPLPRSPGYGAHVSIILEEGKKQARRYGTISSEPQEGSGMWPLLQRIYDAIAEKNLYRGYVTAPLLLEFVFLLGLFGNSLTGPGPFAFLKMMPPADFTGPVKFFFSLSFVLAWLLPHAIPYTADFFHSRRWKDPLNSIPLQFNQLARASRLRISLFTLASSTLIWQYNPNTPFWLAIIVPFLIFHRMMNHLDYHRLVDSIRHFEDWKKLPEFLISFRPNVDALGGLKVPGENLRMINVALARLEDGAPLDWKIIENSDKASRALKDWMMPNEAEWGKIPWFIVPGRVKAAILRALQRPPLPYVVEIDVAMIRLAESIRDIPLVKINKPRPDGNSGNSFLRTLKTVKTRIENPRGLKRPHWLGHAA